MESRESISVGVWANVVTKTFRGALKPVPFKELDGLQVDIPKQLNIMKVAMRVAHYPYDGNSLRCASPPPYVVVGGTVEVEIFFLPPPPKQVKGTWLLRPANVITSKLTPMSYGESHGPGAILTALKVHFKVPEKVFLVPSEADRKVVRWDEEKLEWTPEGVHQDDTLHFNPDTREVVFNTQRNGTFALVGSRVSNFPYLSWSLVPALEVKAADSEVDIEQDEEGCIHLSLSTRIVETITIQIRAGVCQLLEPKVRAMSP